MKVLYMGGKQAGCIGLLTLLAAGYDIEGIIAYDVMVRNLAARVIPWGERESGQVLIFNTINQWLGKTDLVVCVHGREKVPRGLLEIATYGGINIHPCLYGYKGERPVERLLAGEGTIASVGAHRMTDKIDEGEVLVETFVDISGKTTEAEVYNALYPYYSLVLLEAMGLSIGQEILEGASEVIPLVPGKH